MPSFLGPVNYPVGQYPSAVVSADFNGDGRLDLAMLAGDGLSIVLGNGDGTFQAARTFATGANPYSLVAADFNGDGRLDLGMFTSTAGGLSILLGNGDGTFGGASNIDIGSNPVAMAAGDLNGDNKIDLVVTSYLVINAGEGGGDQQWYMNVLLGNGDGTFAQALTTDPGLLMAQSVALADVNADGRLDVVTVYNQSGYNNGGAVVLLGNGDGIFQPAAAYQTVELDDSVDSIAVADFNGDGKPDLATGGGGCVSILLGNGDGTFGAAQGANAVGSSLTVADFNGDGKPDLATTASVLLGNGDGTLQAPTQYYSTSSGYAVAAADFNGDGLPDLAVTNDTSNTVAVFVNDGNWSAAPLASSFVVSGFPSPTTAGKAGTFTVTAENAGGTTATGYSGTVHFTSSDGQAVLPADYTFTAADAGVHTFSATLETAGMQSITAKDAVTGTLTGTDGGITVSPAAASQFVVTAPSTVSAGAAFSLTVKAEDAYGNVVTGYTGTVHFKCTDARARLPVDYAFTAADQGVHTFTGLVLRKRGTQKITVTDTLNSSLTGSVVENVV